LFGFHAPTSSLSSIAFAARPSISGSDNFAAVYADRGAAFPRDRHFASGGPREKRTLIVGEVFRLEWFV